MTETADLPSPALHRWHRRVGTVALGAVVLGAAALGGAVASLRSEAATAWWLAHLPGVSVTAPRGALWGAFSAGRLEVALSSGALRVDDLRWTDPSLDIGTGSGAWGTLHVAEIAIGRIAWQPSPPPAVATPSRPSSPPRHLRSPLAVRIDAVQVGEITLPALGDRPLRDLALTVGLGSDSGRQHRIGLQRLRWDTLDLSGEVGVDTGGDLALDAQLRLAQPARGSGRNALPALVGTLHVAGPLAQPALNASVGPDGAPPWLQARARLQPFAPWPLSALDADLQGLDLSRLAVGAPRTDLRGRLLATPEPDAVTLNADLQNPAAGAWNTGRLPLRTLQSTLKASTTQPSAWVLEQLSARFGAASAPAGAVQLSGRAGPGGGWALDAQLQALQPQRLDGRAPLLSLTGPLRVQVAADTAVSLRTQLSGEVPTAGRAAARPVQAELEAAWAPGPGAPTLDLKTLRLEAGPATASLQGTARRTQDAGPWQLAFDGQFQAFDPLLWWPGAADRPAAAGSTTLNGDAHVAGTLNPMPPAGKAQTAPRAVWQPLFAAFTGEARLKLADSRLLGQPLQAALSITGQPGGAGALDAELRLADNRLSATARVAAQPSASDHAELDLRAPALQQLQPLAALLAGTAARAFPLAGQADAKARIEGRWPDLSTAGTLSAQGVQAGPHALQRASARWQVGTTPDAPATLTASLSQGRFGGQALDTAELGLQGTGRAHALSVMVRAPWAGGRKASGGNAEAAVAAPGPSTLRLALQGGLTHDAPALPVAPQDGPMSAWRGSLQTLVLTDAGGVPLVQAQPVAISAQWSDAALGLAMEPGRVDLRFGPTASALRWTRALWQQARSSTARAVFDVDGAVDPFPVAPLLQQLQPDFGWDGDLVIGGRVALRSSPAVTADIVVERQKGDLVLANDDGTRQTLGLTDLRFGLTASNGVWNFTQAVAGRALGVAAGAVVARTADPAALPTAETPVQGVVELRVANLEAWASWVPTGWRLGGSLLTSATVGGRLGGPELTGRLEGRSLSVRNVLQGVHVTDGDVAVTLAGETARIERFTARGGNGTLRIGGDARLGAAPSANLLAVAEKFQFLGRVDQRVVASGQAQLRLAPDRVALDGNLAVDEGLIDFTKGDAPSLSDDVVVTRAKATPPPATATPARAAPAAPPNPKRSFALNVTLALGEQLRLKGRGLDTRLAGDLRLTAPGGNLALNGAVRTVGGNYAAYGQKLTIDRGTITFLGTPGNPRLDIEATRPRIDVKVGVQVTGTALNPRVRLFSEPELPEVDKLSWLVLGRASSGLGRTDTALLQRAAVALLSGENEGVAAQFTKAIGLDDISLRQTEGEVKETIVTLGKQLSERLYVGYERGLNNTAGSFQLIYRIAQRFTLRGQTGADNAVDAVYTWRWK